MSAKVYRRDVSWYCCGRGGSASKYHFLGHDLASSCGRARILMTEFPKDAERIDPILRCKAKGCVEKWAAPGGPKP